MAFRAAVLLVAGCLAGCTSVLGWNDLEFGPTSPGVVVKCTPKTCAELEANCGSAPDGCGGVVLCGQCSGEDKCGGGGTNACGKFACAVLSCEELGVCGVVSDGCGSTLDCAGQCASECSSCQSQGVECGTVDDGCGAELQCGDCTAPAVCNNGKCTKEPVCTTCEQRGAECGSISDGCGKTLDCGSCSTGSCSNNKCNCAPKTCADLGASCGSLADGCGGNVSCGDCSGGQTCDSGTHQCTTPSGHHETKTDPGGTGQESGGIIPVCCVPSTQEKQMIMQVFEMLNEHRQNNGLPALTYDDKLEAAIEGHCHHMADHDFFAHSAPESVVSSPSKRGALCGTSAKGENIAAGQQSASEVMTSWKNSSGHNANMLGQYYSRVGIGFYQGGSWGTYWGQLFD